MRGINPNDLRYLVIRPTLQKIGLWSLSAELLLLGTCLVESEGGHYLKQVNGPALSIFMIEPVTFYYLWREWLPSHIALLTKLNSLRYINPAPEQMIYDLQLTTITCRLKYLTDPSPLPDATDISGLAAKWKEWYNTAQGAGDPKKFELLLNNYLNAEGALNGSSR